MKIFDARPTPPFYSWLPWSVFGIDARLGGEHPMLFVRRQETAEKIADLLNEDEVPV